ncbi:Cof-type HAD-IIB family hydrolase [Enterococcus sp. BWR-S5]|uniref:Cof-type HAD-IIB family hydrolase n=1 Tax=Enterococcus sp. BWR-S5 TaxID=2787714 RepID=UPI001920C8CB|nr:Cof-type HAD-IIB family hydrolase [Enterococcus sp. BWR-S5]MBL1226918.1 HAD family phosphatase [Enterococcus sp. BWR-S5]
MAIKAIVLDIDGTLLNDEKEISAKTKQALINAQEQGIKVILASGRPTTGMQKHVKELQLDKYEGFIVSFNGACVIDCKTDEMLFNQAMSVEDSKAILEHLKQFDVKPMIDKEDYLYVNDVFDNIVTLPTGEFNIIEYESRGGNFKLCEIDDLAAFVDFPLNKILIAGDPDYLQEHHVAMKAPFEGSLNAMFTAPVYFEFTDKGIDKAKALDSVLPNFGIHAEEVISFGDGHNDRSIIEYAGVGVAMANAVDDLKAADEITLSNNEDGIAVMLEKYL